MADSQLYRPLFSLELSHAYYRRQIPRDLSIEPGADARALLDAYGMVFRQNPQGCRVFIPAARLDWLKTESRRLVFYLSNRNPAFINFTDLPLDFDGYRARDLLFFANAPGRDLLHAGDFAGPAERIAYSSGKIRLELSEEEAPPSSSAPDLIVLPGKPGARLEIQLRDPERNSILRSELIEGGERKYFSGSALLRSEKLRPDERLFTINWSDEAEGLYELIINGAVKKKFCLLRAAGTLPPLGMIAISPAPLPELAGDGNSASPEYQLRFNARATRWTYFFIPETPNLELLEMKITEKKKAMAGEAEKPLNGNGQGKPLFGPPEERRLPGNQAVQAMTSIDHIPLQEQSDRTFQFHLKAQKKIEEKAIQKTTIDLTLDLPRPQADRIKVNGGQVHSEVFVYF